MKKQIKIDLVKQYAENQGKRQQHILVFISVIVVVFTAVGVTFSDFIYKMTTKSLILFTVSSSFSLFLLTIVVVLSLFLSYSLRRDQFIIDKIRKKAFKKKEYKHLFRNYKPKKSIQDFYLILITSSCVLQFFITLLLSISLLYSSFLSSFKLEFSVFLFLLYLFLLLFSVFVGIFCFMYYDNKLKC